MEQVKGRIAEVLGQAEREILGFLAEAAAQGDYEGIDVARTAASKVRQLASELGSRGASKPAGSTGKKSSAPAERRRRSRAEESRGTYPRFVVADDCLLREGWSKKQRKPYTHRVPVDVYRTVVAALQRVAEASNGAVTAEAILEEPGLHEGSPVPAYQIYTVLGFLRSEQVVREVGRGRYQLPSDIGQQASSLWERRLQP